MSNHNWEEVKHRANGQWQQILSSLAGLDESQLRNKHGPCPNCGGKDRYRFDDKAGDGTYICSQCGAGDGMSLLVKCTSMSFPDCVNAVGEYLHLDPGDQKRVYTKPKPFNKVTSTRKNDFVDKEAAQSWLSETTLESMCVFTARNRIKTPVNVNENCFVLWPIERAKQIVNCLSLSENNKLSKYAAGGMTNGGYHRINENEGRSIFFCVNIIDSHLTAQFTKSECVCCFEYANLLDAIEQYIEDYKPEKPIYISCNNDKDELILAEKSGYKIIMPLDSDDIQTSSGFHKQTYLPEVILDNE